MNKLFFVAALFLTSSLFCSEWIDCSGKTLPSNRDVIFYDRTNHIMMIGNPYEYTGYMLQYNDMFVYVSHYMECPKPPEIKDKASEK